MNPPETSFYVTGGTVRPDAACYVERKADRDLFEGLRQAEFCYVLTSRQMGKSSLMVRTAQSLREQQVNVIVLDLTAIGLNLTPEQWYDGLVVRMGRQLELEDELDDFWIDQQRLSPVQRFFQALREIVMPRRAGQLVIFIDEIDTVRSLPFTTDELFAAIRECYNRRVEDPELNRLTFCLLGVATPADLIRDPHMTPFNIGRRVELTDFTPEEAAPLEAGLSSANFPAEPAVGSRTVLDRILYWTNGHPYLTQRLCRAVVEDAGLSRPLNSAADIPVLVDALCEELYLSTRAHERDDNLLFVRERLLRSNVDLAGLLGLYEQVHRGQSVLDDEANPLIEILRLAGITRVADGRLVVRNRVYARVFDQDWIRTNMPDAMIENPQGERISIRGTTSIGRAPANSVVLANDKVSRRHALIQAQAQHEFWLVDLGSSNGTLLNGRRVTQPVLLRHQDRIQIGPFRLNFYQPRGARPATDQTTVSDRTLCDIKTMECWFLGTTLAERSEHAPAMSLEQLSVATGKWLADCKQIVEESGCKIHQYLDHGFLAYCPRSDKALGAVTQTLENLHRLQQKSPTRFRILLHYGAAFLDGAAGASGEPTLSGREFELILALDGLAGQMKADSLITESARVHLRSQLPVIDAGRKTLSGLGEIQLSSLAGG